MIKRAWELIKNLSLDVTAGAVISSLFVGKVFKVQLSLNMLLDLATLKWKY
ncbi:MAG: hypothetical protein ACJAS3_002294 [Roseivirga sp.]|jgi:hypothetical protein